MGNAVPERFLACDGTIYNIADYQSLADHIDIEFGSYNFFGGDGTTTFAVPDLRGEFLRGTGTNSHTNQGSGANVGVHQNATGHPNIKSASNYIYLNNTPSSGGYVDFLNEDSKFNNNGNGIGRGINYSNSWNTQEGNIVTSRPTNTSVLYCIKYI